MGHQHIRRGMHMGIERIVQYECKVCGRRMNVTRTGELYEEPVYCCGLDATEVNAPEELAAPATPAVRKKPAKKKAAKKAVKKKAAKKAKKKAVKKKAAKKKATKKKAAKKKTAKKKAKKKASKRR
jgi:hypothetical protein